MSRRTTSRDTVPSSPGNEEYMDVENVGPEPLDTGTPPRVPAVDLSKQTPTERSIIRSPTTPRTPHARKLVTFGVSGLPPGSAGAQSQTSNDPPPSQTDPRRGGEDVPVDGVTSPPLDYTSITSPVPSDSASVRRPRSRNAGGRAELGSSGGRFGRQKHIDVGSSQEATASQGLPSTQSTAGDEPVSYVWATNIVTAQVLTKFREFLTTFRLDSSPELVADAERFDELQTLHVDEPLYLQKLAEINATEDPVLNLNCAQLRFFDAELYSQLLCYPNEVITMMDHVANELFSSRFPDADLERTIQVRPYNAERASTMRLLNPEHIDQIVTLNGMVIRASGPIPQMREAFFECVVCAHTTLVPVERGNVREPASCPHCQNGHTFQLIHNRARFDDKQLVKLQEAPDEMPAGQTPYTILLYAHNDLLDKVQPGDRVQVTGIFRAMSVRLNPKQRSVRPVFKTYVDVLHYRRMTSNRLRETADVWQAPEGGGSEEETARALNLPPERLEQLRRLNAMHDLYERLANALAYSIHEHDDIKKGILLQLFGGSRKELSRAGGSRTHWRSDINILLCGDPSTSKSQLLQYVYNLVPRSQYTTGKGTSAVGLTAYLTKDPDTKQLTLQTGALVLCDNGVCCIDEFDKMSESTRTILHEAMEQQTLSIAKAGIICQLNARTSVLAAANPVESQWNRNKTIIENIQLPHTLLSRFDLIFLMLDPQEEGHDQRLARHLVSLYYRSKEEEMSEALDISLLRDYMTYAKAHYNPKLNEEASQLLVEEYVSMRRANGGIKGAVAAYPRQLESLIRLAEAHAKMRWSHVVEPVDVKEARRLQREALKQSATDPATGRIDINILATGVSSTARRRKNEIAQGIKRILLSHGGGIEGAKMSARALLEEMRKAPAESGEAQATAYVPWELFEEVLRALHDEGALQWNESSGVVRALALDAPSMSSGASIVN